MHNSAVMSVTTISIVVSVYTAGVLLLFRLLGKPVFVIIASHVSLHNERNLVLHLPLPYRCNFTALSGFKGWCMHKCTITCMQA